VSLSFHSTNNPFTKQILKIPIPESHTITFHCAIRQFLHPSYSNLQFLPIPKLNRNYSITIQNYTQLLHFILKNKPFRSIQASPLPFLLGVKNSATRRFTWAQSARSACLFLRHPRSARWRLAMPASGRRAKFTRPKAGWLTCNHSQQKMIISCFFTIKPLILLS
jgi:hypothetical protein